MVEKTAFLYPGQGAQYPGMGRDLYERSTKVKEIFEQASEAASRDIAKLVFESSAEELQKTENTQIAMTAVNLSAAAFLEENGVISTASAGFSLGECSALAGSGILDSFRVFKLVLERGRIMQEATAEAAARLGELGMGAVLGMDFASAEAAIRESGIENLFAANENSPVQVVLSGTKKALDEAASVLKEKGAKRVIPLKVSGAFHCPLMEEARLAFDHYLSGIEFKDPEKAFYSNVTGKAESSGETIKSLAGQQLVTPVRWVSIEKELEKAGYFVVAETGPGKVLSGLWQKSGCEGKCIPAGNADALSQLQ